MTELDWHAERADLEGLAQLDREPADKDIDLVAVRGYRLNRVRAQMAELGVDALILSDPINIRYATGARNMQVFSMRNAPSRYLLLTQNDSILYEFTGCLHLADGLETIDEVRPAKTASFVAAGPHIAAFERAWAQEMADEMHVSRSTARTHVQNVLRKLGVHSRLEAVAAVSRRRVDGQRHR